MGALHAPLRGAIRRRPDYAAGQAYDSVLLVVAAIRHAGLNRPRINDAVRELSPWPGVTGPIRWNRLGQNERAVGLGTGGAATCCPSTESGKGAVAALRARPAAEGPSGVGGAAFAGVFQ